MKFDIIETLTDIDDEFIASAKPVAQKPVELKPVPRRKRFAVKSIAAAAACAVLVCGTVFTVSRIGYMRENAQNIMTYENSDSVEKIYDSLEINAPKEETEFRMSEFPDTGFKVSEWGEVFIKPKDFAEYVSLGLWNYNQYPHSSVYLFDVTEDGMRDICVASGGCVSIYDCVNDRIYSVSGYNYNKEYSLICADDLDQMPAKSGVEQVYDSVRPSHLPGADELGGNSELGEYPDSLFLIGATEDDWETMLLGKKSKSDRYSFMDYAGLICIDWIIPPVIDNDDFKVSYGGLITNWERNNPVKIWDSADGEKVFTFEEFSELTVTINDMGVFFVNDERGKLEPYWMSPLCQYYTSDIVKMYSAYAADIDGDGERELCVLADVKTADGRKISVDTFVLYYDIWYSLGVEISGSYLSNGHYFDFEDGELFIDESSTYNSLGVHRRTISGPTYHGCFNSGRNSDDGIMHWSNRIHNAEWCRVFDDFANFNEPTILEDIEFRIKEFPESDHMDRKFKYNVSGRTLTVKDGDIERVIVSNVLALYLIDVNGDGSREFCATVSKDGDWRKTGVYIYDMVNDKEYLFSSDDIQYAVSGEDLRVFRSGSWKRTDLAPGVEEHYTLTVPVSEAVLPEFDVNDFVVNGLLADPDDDPDYFKADE